MKINALVEITKILEVLVCLFTTYIIVHSRSSGYFVYHKFKRGKLEGNLRPGTDNEGPEEEWRYSSTHSCQPRR